MRGVESRHNKDITKGGHTHTKQFHTSPFVSRSPLTALSHPLLAPARIELQLQRELDVVREGARLVVVKRVVEDREDALGRDRVGRW